MHPKYPDISIEGEAFVISNDYVDDQQLDIEWEFPIYEAQLHGSDVERLNSDLEEICLELEKALHESDIGIAKSHDDDIGRHGGPTILPYIGRYTPLYVNHPAISTYFAVMKKAHKMAVDSMGLEYDRREHVRVKSWFSTYRGGGISPHSHRLRKDFCYLALNYCVNATDETATVFELPGFRNTVEDGGDEEHVGEYHSVNNPGKMTFFPHWVPHYSTSYDSDRVRITLASNFDRTVEYKPHQTATVPLTTPPFLNDRFSEESANFWKVVEVVNDISMVDSFPENGQI